MNRILFVILTVLLILSIFATDRQAIRERYIIPSSKVTPTHVLAPIHDINIWADESLPPQYFVEVVSGEPLICDQFDTYNVTRAGNTTVIVEILNLRLGAGCPVVYSYVEHTIPLGSNFVTGGNYTVVVNNVTETFVA